MIERVEVDLTRAWLDPAPLDREAVRVLAKRGEESEVAIEAVELIASVTRFVGERAGLLGRPPVVIGVARPRPDATP